MKKEKDFVSLLQDEHFVQLVKETITDKNQLNILEEEYPEHKLFMAQAVDFISIQLSQNKKIEPEEAQRIWNNIRSATVKIRPLYSHLIVKIAAAVLLLLGSVWFMNHYFEADPLKEVVFKEVKTGNEAVIILSDGSKHNLDVNGSQIEYTPEGDKVVVRSKKKEEKIENTCTSKTNINQIIVPYGHKHTLHLSDGTEVTLNSGSRLAFPAEFAGNVREVYLSGEGYFKVSKNPDKPFIVKCDYVNVKVLGTVFNISSYKDEETVSAVLVEGKVMVSQKNKLFGYSDHNIEPGQGCFYSTLTFTSSIKTVNTEDYTSWKDGYLLFKCKSLSEITKKVEKYYNNKILIDGEELGKTLISGKLVLSENMDDVAQYLSKTVEGKYFKNQNGSYLIKSIN